MARQGFDVATRLLLGLDAPVLFVKSDGDDALVGRTRSPIRAGPDPDIPRATAQRRCRGLSETTPKPLPERPAPAWRVPPTGSWPAGSTATACSCVPWQNPNETGVAVFSPAPATQPGTAHGARPAPLGHGGRHQPHLRARADEQMRLDLEDSIARRYVDHARRIAHEASNPLTVIKTYLG